MTTMVDMGAMVTHMLAMVEAGAMEEGMGAAGVMEEALMGVMELPRWEVQGVEVVVHHEGLPVRGEGEAREGEVLDTMLRPTERIRVMYAGHEREPIKITNSSSGVPVLNVK